MKERKLEETIQEYISLLPDEYQEAKALALVYVAGNARAVAFLQKLFPMVEAARVPLLGMKGGVA